MVVGKFRRSESFPAPKPAGSRSAAAAKSSFRARCISLPSRSHPLAAHLADDLHSLLSWPPSPSPSHAAHWLSDGLARIHLLLAGLADVLQLPQAQDPLRRPRRSPALGDRLLDDFLRLADAHGSFRSAALAIKQHLAAAQAAARRRDEARLASCLRARRRAGKELAELAAAVREVRKRPQPPPAAGTGAAAQAYAEEEEVARVMGEVVAAVAEASAAVFLGVAEMSEAATSAAEVAPSRFAWVASVARWRTRATSKSLNKKASPEKKKKEAVADEEEEGKWRRAVLEGLGAAEDGVASLATAAELVFRSLVNVRVTLLNILTPGI